MRFNARDVGAIAGVLWSAIVLSTSALAQPQELPKGLAPSGSSVSTPSVDAAKPAAPAPTLPDGTLAVPPLARVTDTAGVLDSAARAQLDAKLAAFEQARGAQIAVIVVPSTQPEPISDFANRVGGVWKIGRAGIGDGVL
ncbi:MAG: TPM domain-containing protein, partial [Burkholderiaceae bacterium]|nr:TPM domain-containing protein [Burkholderiaceae bacterium]